MNNRIKHDGGDKMDIENWQTVYRLMIYMSYLGVVTTSINLFIKIHIERRSLHRWFLGGLMHCFKGFLLFGLPFAVFGFLANNPLKRDIFYRFVTISAIMPIWMDPLISIKFWIDRQSYTGNQRQLILVDMFLVLISIILLVALIVDKWFAY